MQHEFMTAVMFTNNFAGPKWNRMTKENISNAYEMGWDASKNCGVTDNAPQLYGCVTHIMLNVL